MASYTSNLNLKKPAGSENVAIGDINNNMDLIDNAYGTLSTNVDTFKTLTDTSVNYTEFDNIPVNALGRIRFASNISPTNSEAIFAVVCFGNSTRYRVIIATTLTTKNIYQICCNGGTWTQWAQLSV